MAYEKNNYYHGLNFVVEGSIRKDISAVKFYIIPLLSSNEFCHNC